MFLLPSFFLFALNFFTFGFCSFFPSTHMLCHCMCYIICWSREKQHKQVITCAFMILRAPHAYQSGFCCGATICVVKLTDFQLAVSTNSNCQRNGTTAPFSRSAPMKHILQYTNLNIPIYWTKKERKRNEHTALTSTGRVRVIFFFKTSSFTRNNHYFKIASVARAIAQNVRERRERERAKKRNKTSPAAICGISKCKMTDDWNEIVVIRAEN